MTITIYVTACHIIDLSTDTKVFLFKTNSYMILAPAIMQAEKDPKEAARKCLEAVELDPESYRIGHTKARLYFA